MQTPAALLFVVVMTAGLVSCARRPALQSVPKVDLERYAGDWFVIAHLPARVEREAYSAIEHYHLRADGKIDIRYTFNEGSFDGEYKTLTMTGQVYDRATNAEWRVRPFWPLSLAYVVIELDQDYQTTVVGHPSRDYVWIMARSPCLPGEQFETLKNRLRDRHGYDLRELRMVPQTAGSAEAGCREAATQ